MIIDPNIVHKNLKHFLNHGASYKGLLVQSSLRVTGFGRELFRAIRKPYEKCKEDDSHLYLAILSLRTTKNSSGTSPSELLMKRKLWTLAPWLNVNVNTNMKLKKPTVSQSGEL